VVHKQEATSRAEAWCFERLWSHRLFDGMGLPFLPFEISDFEPKHHKDHAWRSAANEARRKWLAAHEGPYGGYPSKASLHGWMEIEDEDVREILRCARKGTARIQIGKESVVALSKRLGIHRHAVLDIRNGRSIQWLAPEAERFEARGYAHSSPTHQRPRAFYEMYWRIKRLPHCQLRLARYDWSSVEYQRGQRFQITDNGHFVASARDFDEALDTSRRYSEWRGAEQAPTPRGEGRAAIARPR
jgi:hypothetical protein